MSFPKTVNILVEQVFSAEVFVEREMIDSLESKELVHIKVRLAPGPK